MAVPLPVGPVGQGKDAWPFGQRLCGDVKNVDAQGNGQIECELLPREIKFLRANAPADSKLEVKHRVLFTVRPAPQDATGAEAVRLQLAPSADDIDYTGSIKQFDGVDGSIASEDITSSVSFSAWELPEEICKSNMPIVNERIQFSIRLTANAKPHAAKIIFNKAFLSKAQMATMTKPMEPKPLGQLEGTVKNYKRPFGYGFISTAMFPRPIYFQRTVLMCDEASIVDTARVSFNINYNMPDGKPYATLVQLAGADFGTQASMQATAKAPPPDVSSFGASAKAPAGPLQPGVQPPLQPGVQPLPPPGTGDGSLTDYHDKGGERITGTVKNYFKDRGYGFVQPDTQAEQLYFSQFELQACGCEISSGARVEFKVQTKKDGKQMATSLSYISPPPGAKQPIPVGQVNKAPAARSAQNKGKVRFHNDAKNYGFISCPGVSNNVYFQGHDISGNPPRGDLTDYEVTFEMTQGQDGKPIAKNIVVNVGSTSLLQQPVIPGPQPVQTGLEQFNGKRFCGMVKSIDSEGNGAVECEILPKEIRFQREELPFQAVDQWGNISLTAGCQVVFTVQAGESMVQSLGGSSVLMAVNVQIAPSYLEVIYRGTVRWFDEVSDEGSIYCDDLTNCVRFSGWEVPDSLHKWVLDGALVRFSIRLSPDAKPMASRIEWNFDSLGVQQVPPRKPSGSKLVSGQYYDGKISRWNPSFKYGYLMCEGFENEVYFCQHDSPDGLQSLGAISIGQEVRFKMTYGENGKPCGQMVHSSKLRATEFENPEAKRQRMDEIVPLDGNGGMVPMDGMIPMDGMVPMSGTVPMDGMVPMDGAMFGGADGGMGGMGGGMDGFQAGYFYGMSM